MSTPVQKPWVVLANICTKRIYKLQCWQQDGNLQEDSLCKPFFFSPLPNAGLQVELKMEPDLVRQNFQEAK